MPAPVERSTYVLFSSLALLLLFWKWEPMGGVVWSVENTAGRLALNALFAAGWLTVLVATFLINHFDLFGLRQVWLHLLGRPYTSLKFRTPGLYRLVRHPLYVGWLMVFWSAPVMTAAHLVFAIATTAYILIAIQFEERDLVRAHAEYADYRRRVPMILPIGSPLPRETAGVSGRPAPEMEWVDSEVPSTRVVPGQSRLLQNAIRRDGEIMLRVTVLNKGEIPVFRCISRMLARTLAHSGMASETQSGNAS